MYLESSKPNKLLLETSFLVKKWPSKHMARREQCSHWLWENVGEKEKKRISTPYFLILAHKTKA